MTGTSIGRKKRRKNEKEKEEKKASREIWRNDSEAHASVAICGRDVATVNMPAPFRPLSKDTSTGRGEREIGNSARTRGLWNVPLPSRSTASYQSRGCTAGRVYRRKRPEERARGTRERKGDDKSGRARRIEKVAPVGPGNGIPVLDSAGESSALSCNKTRPTESYAQLQRLIGQENLSGRLALLARGNTSWPGLFIMP